MESQVYQQIFDVEQKHWWFVGRRKIILAALKKFFPQKVAKALDIGCGTGLNSLVLRQVANEVIGLDPAPEAVRLSGVRVPEFTVLHQSFPNTSLNENFELISMFDVLEHIEDDAASVIKLESLLKPGGLAIITVPAFPFLWTEHDRVLHHYRRYTIKTLKKLIKSNTQLSIVKINYFNSLLFVPIAVFRLFRKIFRFLPNRADDFMVPKLLNSFLLRLFEMEGKLVNKVRYPFGISIICVLKKQSKSQ